MATYVIGDIEVHDPAVYEKYRQQVPATIAAHGGRYLVRGGATTTLGGDWSPKRMVVLEFPTRAQFDAWWNSPEYQPLRALRESASTGSLVVADGI